MIRPQAEILEIMDIFNQKDPNPRCELNYSNAYTLLVAVVLSAQSTDKGVNRARRIVQNRRHAAKNGSPGPG